MLRSAPTATQARCSTKHSACRGSTPGAATMATWRSTRFRAAAMSTRRWREASIRSSSISAQGSLPTDPEANTSSFSSLFQGLMFDPLMLSGRSRTANLFRRPFVEGSVGGGFINNDADDWGWSARGRVAGLRADADTLELLRQVRRRPLGGFPLRHHAGLRRSRRRSSTCSSRTSVGTGYITAKPTPNDRVVAYVDVETATSPTCWAAS